MAVTTQQAGGIIGFLSGVATYTPGSLRKDTAYTVMHTNKFCKYRLPGMDNVARAVITLRGVLASTIDALP